VAIKQDDTNKEEEKLLLPLPKWKFWYVMIVLYVLYFLDFATRAVVSPMFPILKQDLGLSDAQLGWLSTIVLAMVGLLSIPLSYLIDRWSRRKMLALMSVVWSIGSFFSGLSANFTQLLVTRGVLGVGEASFNSGGQSMIMAMVKKARRATVTGIWTTAPSLGMAVGMVIGGWVAVHMGWRTAFMIVAIPGIIFGILAWFMPDFKNRPKDHNGAAGSSSMSFSSTMKSILTNRTAVTLFISFGLLYYFLNTIVTWLPTYFNRYMGMDVATAGSLTAVVLVSALIASPLGGWLGDLISRKNPANKMLLSWICVCLSIICYVAAILFNAWPLFFVVTFFSYMYIPAQHTASQEIVPFYLRASTYGVYIFCMFFLGGLWGPAVTGMVSDASSLQVGFWVNGAVAVVGSIGYFITYKFFNRDYATARKLEEGVIQ
jgi:MFS family permease